MDDTRRAAALELLVALDELADGIVVVDASGAPVGANRTIRRLITGQDPADPWSLPADRLVAALMLDAPDGDALREAVARALAGEVTWVVRTPVVAADDVVHRTAWVSPLTVADHTHAAITFSAEDARLEVLLEHTTDIITVLEPDGTIRYSNPAAGRLTGYEGLILAGTSAFDLIHPDDRDRVLRTFAVRLGTPGRSEPVQFRLRFGDGTWHVVEAYVNNLVDDPDVQGAVVTLHDVSERVRAEEQLARSEERFRSLVEHLSDVIVVIDADANVTYASPAIDRIIGLPSPTHLGLSAFNDVHPDDLPLARSTIEDVLAHPGEHRRFEVRLQHVPSGEWRWVDVIAANHLGDPAVEGVVCTVRDVTELKEAEQALREGYEHEKAAAEQLRAADRVKDEFLATVSHELRTPLTSIIGFTDVLMRKEESDPALHRRLLERVAANAEEMRSMVEQILDVSKLEAGRVLVDPRPVRLAGHVGDCIDALADRLAAHEVAVDVPADLAAMTDVDALGHVLRNLISNAAKFSPPGSKVTVRGERSGADVLIGVTDEGPGIDAEDRERVFERFFQARSAPAGPGKRGTGLGLSIAQRYVELQGGRIWVDSDVGRGSTFWFTLPAADAR